jgi:hypothetical protein
MIPTRDYPPQSHCSRSRYSNTLSLLLTDTIPAASRGRRTETLLFSDPFRSFKQVRAGSRLRWFEGSGPVYS